LGDEHPDVAIGVNHLATLLRDQGKLDESETRFRQALAIARRTLGPDQADTARIEVNLGELLAKRGKLQESEQLLRESLRARRQILPAGHPDIFAGEARVGSVLAQQGRFPEAEALMLDAWRGLESADSPVPTRRLAAERIMAMYTAWERVHPGKGKAKQAAEWKALAAQIR
jgi:tetratricopeptide (TPR) repeat protein